MDTLIGLMQLPLHEMSRAMRKHQISVLLIQWGSEIRPSLNFEWLKRNWVANGPDFKWDLKSESPTVVFFDPLLGAELTRKLGQDTFGAVFNFVFCFSFQTFFSDFLSEIKKKCLKNSVLSYSLKLVDMQTLVNSLMG